MDKYIVILNGGQGRPLPMMNEDENIVLFDKFNQADIAAMENPLGQTRGYEIFLWEYFEG